ncbi:hypothetical protein [Ktedonobacter sp. SOSP1-52]|uniref:hypothetical protein n=1 Tax=Ktedonobacter sp. SOSP1-52 TaxID=2778366 RepID=UPI0019154581|nr:hypothetical protein [Ktedonobacter sp. SOSP1-52]
MYTSSLQDISQYNRAMVGGKALNLSKMISAGLPVPSGGHAQMLEKTFSTRLPH